MKIAIIGSGSWGTALSLVAHRAYNQVTIWSRNSSTCLEINNNHLNNSYLKNISIPESIKATSNLAEILDNDILLLVVPSQTIRKICEDLARLNLASNKIIVICAKGIEQESLKLMSEVVNEVLPNNPVAILSGPNFALEVAQNHPAIASLSCSSKDLSLMLSEKLTSANFRIYPNQDIIGTQIIGAAKNVLAIATGITLGKKMGENAKAAIFSRGICEINNLILAKKGKVETMFSPAGLGDLYLTCGSATSRNTAYGISLALGKVEKNNVIEGINTSKSIYLLAKSLNINMPVIESVYKIIHQGMSIDIAIEELLSRPLKI
jgi:glycerol-3-phosphate dehydrogenase (NAD(P)+)